VLTVLFLLVTAPGHAQTVSPAPAPSAPPPAQSFPGFVSSYEIVRIIRGAGFTPQAPPLREGTIYVVRATDFRGVLMRVVVDARTGGLRDVTRIVPGPGRYGQLYGAPGLDDPASFDALLRSPSQEEMAPQLVRPAAPRAAGHPAALPPLPRPRPAMLVSRGNLPDIKPASTLESRPEINSEVITATPPAVSASPRKAAPADPPLND